MKRYRTRWFSYDREGSYPSPPYQGKGWRAVLEPDPQYLATKHLAAVPYEIVFYARSLRRAEYAAQLVVAADSLANGYLSLFDDLVVVMPEDPPVDENERQEHLLFIASHRGAASGLTLATIIAARASHFRKYQHALFKMRLSYSLCSVHHMDLEPSHWWPRRAVSPSPVDHVSLAYALQSAYSAIEELGLEVRASSANPSTINGRWNPPVLGDLQRRLKRSRINLAESITWTRRDTPTSIERRYPPTVGKKARWARGRVRDREMRVEDAINYCSRLRSKVATHRLPAIAGSLTYYDVINVQHVARRLLMEALRCWRIYVP